MGKNNLEGVAEAIESLRDRPMYTQVTTFSDKTLRDEFAMAALIGLLANQGDDERTAEWAYQHADMMMEARKATPTPPEARD